MAVFGVLEAGLAGAVAQAVGHRRSAVAVLAAIGGAVVAGSAAGCVAASRRTRQQHEKHARK